jgi:hypothetical protein
MHVQGPYLGLFHSSLDPQQTKSQPREKYKRPSAADRAHGDRLEKLGRRMAVRVPDPTPLETDFRHAGWRVDRERVRAALVAANVPEGRQERFCACGSDCMIEFSPTAKRHRVRSFHCGDRFCQPCARARSWKVQANLLRWTEGERVRLVTLTMRANGQPLSKSIDRLIRSFASLRRNVVWKAAVDAGAYVIEVKQGRGGHGWHVHVHALVIGRYLDQRALSRAWLTCTGDSPIVDVRDASNAPGVIGYVCKYLTKSFDRTVAQTPDLLAECVLALRGRRMLGTFGDWRSRRVEGEIEDRGEWVAVGRLDSVWGAAVRGESWALGVFHSLGISAGAGPRRNGATIHESG